MTFFIESALITHPVCIALAEHGHTVKAIDGDDDVWALVRRGPLKDETGADLPEAITITIPADGDLSALRAFIEPAND